MARSDYWQYVLRRPRHAVSKGAAVEVRVERSGAETTPAIEAQLVDLSREGFRLRVPSPLEDRAPITVRIRTHDGMDLTLAGTVRWQRAEDDAWLVGCVADRPTDWETLGELFLHNVLNTDGHPFS